MAPAKYKTVSVTDWVGVVQGDVSMLYTIDKLEQSSL